MPGWDSLPRGECTVTLLDGGTKFHVARADPRILIPGALVREGLGRELRSGVELAGDCLVICGVNRKVIYRIGRHHAGLDVYEAEFPD